MRGAPGSAVRRRQSAMPSPSSRLGSSRTMSGRWRASRSGASEAPDAAPTGTRPGSPRSSTARPARMAGWGSTTAMRVTRGTISRAPNPDVNRSWGNARLAGMSETAATARTRDAGTATTGRPAAVAMVLAAAGSLQGGAAFAVTLFDDLGPGGAAFLRLLLAAVVLLALWRPRVRGHTV